MSKSYLRILSLRYFNCVLCVCAISLWALSLDGKICTEITVLVGNIILIPHSLFFKDIYITNHFINALDATHAAELDMIVSPLFGRVRVDPVHDTLSKSVTKLWASFIKEG